MKSEVKHMLKYSGYNYVFSEDRYNAVKRIMKRSMATNRPLREYLSLDTLNRATWIANHMKKLYIKTNDNQSEQ